MEKVTSTLSRGSIGEQVKALQQYLIGLGYNNVKADGVYGPMTEAAVQQFQLDNGLKGDGVFGPRSLEKVYLLGNSATPSGLPGSGKKGDDPTNMFNTDTGELNPNFVPTTQEELDTYYNAAALTHPTFKGNSPEALEYAAQTGDFSVLNDANGQPFSDKVVREATRQAQLDLKPAFEEEKKFSTAKTEAELRGQSQGFGDFLNKEKIGFEQDKKALDEDAASKGVLFSGGREEKEKLLRDVYNKNLAMEQRRVGDNISNVARDYQYNYGDKAAKNPVLSQYYQLGGQTYNPNSTRDAVNPSSLSSVYNSKGMNFAGVKETSNSANAAIRAAGFLKNKSNKLVGSGYKNQF